ncbi:hypothetical protein GGS23DRAFT_314175 [Durotheca rogersii]|uniref:uncharacterized protein n=1 Tax=Durotheca rogersii TaxID=419775 RepID=UPI002220977A|nr:uncharacterized protein GGS23DRAFT_314175 [Durotheca rogersii]KAI5859585.1 hypothetical protein GGS23DRAFT_314175 [Durotheca rogersii]
MSLAPDSSSKSTVPQMANGPHNITAPSAIEAAAGNVLRSDQHIGDPNTSYTSIKEPAVQSSIHEIASTPITSQANIASSTPKFPPRMASILERSYSRLQGPPGVPPHAWIAIRDHRNEAKRVKARHTSGIPEGATIISLDDDSSDDEIAAPLISSSYRRSLSSGGPVSSRRAPSGLPANAKVISLVGSSSSASSEFVGGEESANALTPSRSFAGNAEKNSHTSNTYSDITGKTSSSTRHENLARIGLIEKERPIPESFFREPEPSDDEYPSPLGATSEQSHDDSDDYVLSHQTLRAVTPLHRTGDVLSSSQLSSSRGPRSGSYPKPGGGFTPINNLSPKIRGQQSAPEQVQTRRFGRGYSKRVRDAFSDASASSASEVEKDTWAPKPGMLPPGPRPASSRQGSFENTVVSPPLTTQRQPSWEPLAWIQKYETLFQGDRAGRLWFANGPFKGYIWSGPGEGSYMFGCRAPDERTLLKAERVAIAREVTRTDDLLGMPSSHDYQKAHGFKRDDTKNERDESLLRTREYHNSGKCTRGSVPGACQNDETALKRNIFPVQGSREQNIYEAAPVLSTSSVTTLREQQDPIKTSSRIATAGQDELDSQVREGSSTKLRPTKTPTRTLSSPSESETASTLITQQLMDCCPPPSNQELAELMSSSPTNWCAGASSPLPEHGQDDSGFSSSSESSSGIPARVVDSTPIPRAEKTRTTPLVCDHPDAVFVLNGIAERRNTLPITYRSPSVPKSSSSHRHNSKTPVGAKLKSSRSSETPTKPPRKPTNTSKTTPKPNAVEEGCPAEANTAVELPSLETEKQTPPKAVSPGPEADHLSPKSFQKINQDTNMQENDNFPRDSDVATLSYVLGKWPKSPESITQIDPLPTLPRHTNGRLTQEPSTPSPPHNASALQAGSARERTPSLDSGASATSPPPVAGTEQAPATSELITISHDPRGRADDAGSAPPARKKRRGTKKSRAPQQGRGVSGGGGGACKYAPSTTPIPPPAIPLLRRRSEPATKTLTATPPAAGPDPLQQQQQQGRCPGQTPALPGARKRKNDGELVVSGEGGGGSPRKRKKRNRKKNKNKRQKQKEKGGIQ